MHWNMAKTLEQIRNEERGGPQRMEGETGNVMIEKFRDGLHIYWRPDTVGQDYCAACTGI